MEDIDTLALRVQHLQIELSKAKADLALKRKEEKAAKAEERADNGKAEVHLASKENHEAKAEETDSVNGTIAKGDQVRIIWDQYWKWNTSTKRMPKTDYEGSTGHVVCTMACFVWVRLDNTGGS